MTPVRPVQPAKSSMVSEGLANHDRSACRDALFSQGPGQPPGMAEQGRTAYRNCMIPLAALLVDAVLIILQVFSSVNSFLLVRPLYGWETSQFLIGRQPFIAGQQLVSWAAGGISCGVLLGLIGTLLTIRIISRISPAEFLGLRSFPKNHRSGAIYCRLLMPAGSIGSHIDADYAGSDHT